MWILICLMTSSNTMNKSVDLIHLIKPVQIEEFALTLLTCPRLYVKFITQQLTHALFLDQLTLIWKICILLSTFIYFIIMIVMDNHPFIIII